jgi:non-specific serine/threonine protein kinase
MLTRPRHNLPAEITSFIGRDAQVERLVSLLRRTRLLTLVGVGGVGKTRLALRVAHQVVQLYPDGVWLTDLSSLREGAQVMPAVARSLDVREHRDAALESTLVERLAVSRALLVVHNCEHLVEACSTVMDDLLSKCPHLQVLATSREPIGIVGEVAWNVPALSLPTFSPAQMRDQLRECEATQLFLERAVASRWDRRLTASNSSTVAQICRRLDGIPLALELAAACVQYMGVQDIAARLDARFAVLTRGSRTAPPRHRTLCAALDWSYELPKEPNGCCSGGCQCSPAGGLSRLQKP